MIQKIVLALVYFRAEAYNDNFISKQDAVNYVTEYVPDFDRSTMDGYAVRTRDTFGCADSIPAILPLMGEVLMGEGADFELSADTCCAVPTGGAVPKGADSVVMLEYTEDYSNGTIGITKSTAPGQNMIFRGIPRKGNSGRTHRSYGHGDYIAF